jgi:hypothetical protein
MMRQFEPSRGRIQAMAVSHQEISERETRASPRVSKKSQILALFSTGISDVEELAIITDSRLSYVASVLQDSKKISGYFDLYTSTTHPMNVYSKFFARRLGFRDEETARRSLKLIDHFYHQFALLGDRAGQHHALMMALTMLDRARWTGKPREASVFRDWLLERLQNDVAAEELSALQRRR